MNQCCTCTVRICQNFVQKIFSGHQKVSYEPVYTLGANIFESMEKIMESQQILSGLPGLDCGSCGSPTCKALAEDIVKGVDCAKPEDCIYLMREQWEQHSHKKEEEES